MICHQLSDGPFLAQRVEKMKKELILLRKNGIIYHPDIFRFFSKFNYFFIFFDPLGRKRPIGQLVANHGLFCTLLPCKKTFQTKLSEGGEVHPIAGSWTIEKVSLIKTTDNGVIIVFVMKKSYSVKKMLIEKRKFHVVI